jgi:hypothetical protein
MGVHYSEWVGAYAHPPPARRGNACHARTLRDGSLGDTFPGTSCQATIVRSLRDAPPGLKNVQTSQATPLRNALPHLGYGTCIRQNSAILVQHNQQIWLEDVDLAKVNVERCVVEDSERQNGTLRLRAHPKNC